MTYQEFLEKPRSFRTDMLKVLNIKLKYRLEFTEQESQINQYLLQFDNDTKIENLKKQFEKCWEIE
jgi:hypothetical protein